MPARHVYMIQNRFVPRVLNGTKRTTVRRARKRMPEAGEIADLRQWSGKPYRSKQIKLGNKLIFMVASFGIHQSGDFLLNGCALNRRAREVFAHDDGFASAADMVTWFTETHGLPFAGFITEWIP